MNGHRSSPVSVWSAVQKVACTGEPMGNVTWEKIIRLIRRRTDTEVLMYLLGCCCSGVMVATQHIHELIVTHIVEEHRGRRSKKLLATFSLDELMEKIPIRICMLLFSFPAPDIDRLSELLNASAPGDELPTSELELVQNVRLHSAVASDLLGKVCAP